MAMNSYSASTTPQGGSYQGDQTNPQGAAADPFAYTQGSLLTPWEGRFNSSGYGGGYSAPAFTPFNYANFEYTRPDVDTNFEEQYKDPAAFRFADFQGPSDFRAPTAEEMRSDPGYQARMDAVKNAQIAGAAHGGVLRSGGFQKGMAQAVGNQASQEYGNVYSRKASEHDRRRAEAQGNYQINQGNTFQAFGANTQNRLNAYQARQGAWQGNADVGLRNDQIGYEQSSGTYDRNQALARTQWQDAANNAAAQASASGANSRASYENDLGDYTRARDEFWTNQDRQYAVLDRERNVGVNAAQSYGSALERGYAAQGENSMGAANARASGTAASGAAYGDMFQNIGNSVGNGVTAYSAGGQASRPGAAAGAYTPGRGQGYASTRNTGITGTLSPDYLGASRGGYNSGNHSYGG